MRQYSTQWYRSKKSFYQTQNKQNKNLYSPRYIPAEWRNSRSKKNVKKQNKNTNNHHHHRDRHFIINREYLLKFSVIGATSALYFNKNELYAVLANLFSFKKKKIVDIICCFCMYVIHMRVLLSLKKLIFWLKVFELNIQWFLVARYERTVDGDRVSLNFNKNASVWNLNEFSSKKKN